MLTKDGFVGHPTAVVLTAEVGPAGQYVIYKIRVGDNEAKWTIGRRFKHFEGLDKRLRESSGAYRKSHVRLPGKGLLQARTSSQIVIERK